MEKEILTIDNLFVTVYDEIDRMISKETINSGNIVNILIYTMQTVELLKNIKGNQKKDLVMKIINKIIDKNVLDELEQKNLKFLAEMTLPSLIDTFISIDKKKLIIKSKKMFKNVFKCCLKNEIENKKIDLKNM